MTGHTTKLIIAFSLLATSSFSQAIPTRAGNNLRTGVYQDSVLTPANVKARGLRVYFKLPLEGDARGTESQPLIAPGVTMQDSLKRDICIVSSLNNLVWSYDPNTGDILWVQKVGIPVKGNSSIDYWQINDHWGVLSTGVIDTDTNIWYGVSLIAPDGVPQHGKHYIVGLNLRDGSFAFPAVLMPAAYDSVMRKQRSSLALATFAGKKTVLFASGTVLETSSTAAGYLAAFDVASKAVTLLPMAQQGGGSGIWMSGSGLVIDANNNIYGVTGNGTFNPAVGDWAETVFKATYTPPTSSKAGKLAIVDWWSPYSDSWRQADAASAATERIAGHSLSTASTEGQPVNAMTMPGMPKGAPMGDEDLGSAPCNFVPQYSELLCAGKDSIGLVVNANNMGKTQAADLTNPTSIAANYAKLLTPPFWYGTFPGFGVSAYPGDAQDLNNNVWFDGMTNHIHSASVVDGNYLYVGAENSNVRAFVANADHTFTYLANSDDVASPDLAGKPPGGMAGMPLAATTGGLLIAIRPHGDANRTVTQGDLFVYDSKNFATRPDGSKQLVLLWRSDQPGHGQAPVTFLMNKFDPAIIYNGKIYLPTYDGNVGTLVLGLN